MTLVASDGVNSAQQSFTITVTAVNDPPSFTSTAPTSAAEDTPYTYTAAATDPDGDTLTFAAPTRPSWLTLSGATLSGTPTQAYVGTHNVMITVSDGTAPAVAQSRVDSIEDEKCRRLGIPVWWERLIKSSK